MGIEAKAKKNNSSMQIPAAYLMIGQINMVRFLRPVSVTETDPETFEETTTQTMVPAAQYVAQAQIYWDQQTRTEQFGDVVGNVAFEFTHVNGQDPVREAYAHINLSGLPGWVLTNSIDIFEAGQP